MYIPHPQRGSVLVYALLIMAAMLALSLALTGILASRLKTATAERSTAVAIDIADSAVEKCLYEVRHSAAVPTPAPLVFQSGAIYAIASASATPVDITSTCSVLGNGSFRFRATGTFGSTRRTLEISQ